MLNTAGVGLHQFKTRSTSETATYRAQAHNMMQKEEVCKHLSNYKNDVRADKPMQKNIHQHKSTYKQINKYI